MKDMNSPTVFYIVLIIAVLNVFGYASTNDWNSLTFFLLATGVTYAVSLHRVLALVVGVVGASLFRASGMMHREGMTTKELKAKTKLKAKRGAAPTIKQIAAPTAAPTISAFENLENLDINVKEQEQLLQATKQMKPMMESMNKMMASLPEGFLQKAVENMTKRSKA
jgi:hypothetical protein